MFTCMCTDVFNEGTWMSPWTSDDTNLQLLPSGGMYDKHHQTILGLNCWFM